MQIDMHYYGVYAMARAAGVEPESAIIIATASQYVDDAASSGSYTCKDESCVVAEATGHHAGDIQNLMPADQRKVWVPFHFLPGNEGAEFLERLICQKDSAIARKMIEYSLTHSKKPFARELIGITAHVYADTFSHYGFSGVSSTLNRVDGGSIKVQVEDPEIRKYIIEKAERFSKKYGDKEGLLEKIRKFVSGTAETLSGALGHGAVATYPDRPYLRWNFNYEQDNRALSERDNRVTFLEACEALHMLFGRFVALAPEYSDRNSARPFPYIKETVASILAVEADQSGRISAWQKAVSEGKLYYSAGESIPVYEGNDWPEQLDVLKDIAKPSDVAQLSVYRFYQAAGHHRNYILREILPASDLVVV